MSDPIKITIAPDSPAYKIVKAGAVTPDKYIVSGFNRLAALKKNYLKNKEGKPERKKAEKPEKKAAKAPKSAAPKAEKKAAEDKPAKPAKKLAFKVHKATVASKSA